jgi:hypothetical protein
MFLGKNIEILVNINLFLVKSIFYSQKLSSVKKSQCQRNGDFGDILIIC